MGLASYAGRGVTPQLESMSMRIGWRTGIVGPLLDVPFEEGLVMSAKRLSPRPNCNDEKRDCIRPKRRREPVCHGQFDGEKEARLATRFSWQRR